MQVRRNKAKVFVLEQFVLQQWLPFVQHLRAATTLSWGSYPISDTKNVCTSQCPSSFLWNRFCSEGVWARLKTLPFHFRAEERWRQDLSLSQPHLQRRLQTAISIAGTDWQLWNCCSLPPCHPLQRSDWNSKEAPSWLIVTILYLGQLHNKLMEKAVLFCKVGSGFCIRSLNINGKLFHHRYPKSLLAK